MTLDSSVYSKEAILATSYWCANICSVSIRLEDSNFIIDFSPIGDNIINEAFEDRFLAMVMHNEIRAKLRAVFAPLETAIVQKAFSPVTH